MAFGFQGRAMQRAAARWRRASLRTKIYVSYLALISLPLLVVAVAAYGTSTSTIEQNAQNFSAQLTAEIQANLDTYSLQATRLTYWPFQARDIQRVLRAYQRPAIQPSFYDLSVMRNELSHLGHERADIDGVYVITASGTLFSWNASGGLVPRPARMAMAWYGRARAADPDTVFLPTGPQDLIAVTTAQVFSLVRALHDAQTGAPLGAVRVDLDASALASVVQRVSLGAHGRLLVMAPDGRVVYPLDPSGAVARLARQIAVRQKRGRADARIRLEAGGQSLLVSSNRSAATGWIVAGVVPVDQLLSGTDHLRALILGVALLCILAGALCATLVVGRLTEPIRQLRGAMERVEARADLDTRIQVRTEDEVGQLAHGFNAMLDEIQRLVDDVLRAQLHEREAELQALQSQINPHFLYNTLESINMLALAHGDRDVSRMVTALGRLLRLTLSSSEPLIPLRNELEHVNHYLVVQRMRYGERIDARIEIDESLLDYLLPKLTLQPLVENALYHGLEPKRGTGTLRVRGRVADGTVEIAVEDDGVGMDEGTLAILQDALRTAAPRGDRSVGLANVQGRLKLYCGQEYGLTLRSALGEGTVVVIRVPLGLQRAAARPPTLAHAHAHAQ